MRVRGASALAAVLLAAPASDPRRPTLRLCWLDHMALDPLSYSMMVAESTAIFAELGVELSWRRGFCPGDAPAPDVVLVVPRPGPGAPGRHGPVLGAVSDSPDLARVIWIHHPSVAELSAHSPRLTANPRFEQARNAGMALGRVVAHELVHALVGSAHASEGLMAPRLDLSLPHPVGLDEATRRAVPAAAREWAAEARRP